MLPLAMACSSNDNAEKDTEKPTISLNYTNGFPQTCVALTKGETYTFRTMVTDNEALASYSIDIHHNFDHHTHDDQGAECELDAVKTPGNPMIYMENFNIEGAVVEYELMQEITIPADVDTGDYHCQFSVIDQTGWQARTSVDIKIVE